MPKFRSNCETFRVSTGGQNREVTTERGMAVVSSWIYGEQGTFIDPQIEPGYGESYPPSDTERLFMRFDAQEPPMTANGVVSKLSVGMEAWASLHAGLRLAEDDIDPLSVYEAVAEDEGVGKIALLSIIDRNPQSFRLGGANLNHQSSEGYKILKDYRAGEVALGGAGISVVMLKEDGRVVVVHKPLRDREERKYSLRYVPNSHEGIYITPITRLGDDPRGETTDPRDEGSGGGSDREPRRPVISPLDESGAEAELPEEQVVLMGDGRDHPTIYDDATIIR
jgi:hypothetical protein